MNIFYDIGIGDHLICILSLNYQKNFLEKYNKDVEIWVKKRLKLKAFIGKDK